VSKVATIWAKEARLQAATADNEKNSLRMSIVVFKSYLVAPQQDLAE
jgi:hypothetical protein